MKYTKFSDIPKFISYGHYEVDIGWRYVEDWIQQHDDDMGVDTDPDFQRAHVWTTEQQIAYVEHCLRGGSGSRMILWNCHDWNEHTGKHPIVLVDGKQRVEAVRAFMRDDIPAFGTLYSNFEDPFRQGTATNFRFNVNSLRTRAEVLRWYLEINAGGVVHTDQELNRVRALLEAEK